MRFFSVVFFIYLLVISSYLFGTSQFNKKNFQMHDLIHLSNNPGH